jgi:hypothetical protein
MKRIRFVTAVLASAVGVVGLFASGHLSLKDPGAMVNQAHAIIGRPLTPMSYAGVARRTTRRAVAGAAVVGGAVYGAPVVVTPACVQAVDVYGRVYTRC